MVQLSVLNWLILNCSPLRREEAIVKVDDTPADQVVAKKIIVVPSFDFNRCRSREPRVELEHLMKLGIWFVQLILILLADYLFAQSDFHVRIRERADIPRSKVEALKQVEVYDAVLLVLELVGKQSLVVLIHEKAPELLRVDVHIDQLLFHLVSFFCRFDVEDVVGEGPLVLELTDGRNVILYLLHALGFAELVLFVILLIVNMDVAFECAHNLLVAFES